MVKITEVSKKGRNLMTPGQFEKMRPRCVKRARAVHDYLFDKRQPSAYACDQAAGIDLGQYTKRAVDTMLLKIATAKALVDA